MRMQDPVFEQHQSLRGLPLRSRYLVQIEGDVRSFSELVPEIAGRNVGAATTADTVGGARISRLLQRCLAYSVPVFLDSGAFSRFVRGAGEPVWDDVARRYEPWIAAGDLMSVVAPDAIGDPDRTRVLQRSWSREITGWISSGARVVVPVQARDARSLEYAMEEIVRFFGPRVWVGVPVRAQNTTPIRDLLLALLRIGRRSIGRDLPLLHLLGLGGGARSESYLARVAAVYRVLRSPHLYQILAGNHREQLALFGRSDPPDDLVVDRLANFGEADLRRFVGCIQTRSTFPCPPGSSGTFGTHPVVDRALREIFVVRTGLPVDAPRAVVLRRLGDLAHQGRDAQTMRVLGRADVSIDWHTFVEQQHDWTELCADAIEQAERIDPCMVVGAWDVDDVDTLLIEHGGLARLETDAQSVSLASAMGRWFVQGRQQEAPAWFRDRPRAFRFRWNLSRVIEDLVQRERALAYKLG